MVNEVNTEPHSRKQMPKTSYSRPVVGSTGKTGSWRVFDPEINYELCTRCRTCWMFCPEACINLEDDDTPRIDLDYCKGCGICANECPRKCISMVRKGSTKEEQ